MPGRRWSAEENAWFDEYAKDHPWREVSAEHERLYGSPLTESQVNNRRRYRGIKCSRRWGQFEKGIPPKTALALPIGTERVVDGYVEVKVSERSVRKNGKSCFRRKHAVIWEQANGCKIPKGHMVLFADKDRRNFDPDNLVLVSKEDQMLLTSMGNPYYDRESLESCIALAKLRGACGKVENPIRPCKVCGKMTKFREKKLKTCQECLDRKRGVKKDG